MFPYTTLLLIELKNLYASDKNYSLFFRIVVSFIVLTAMIGPALFVDTIIFCANIFFKVFK